MKTNHYLSHSNYKLLNPVFKIFVKLSVFLILIVLFGIQSSVAAPELKINSQTSNIANQSKPNGQDWSFLHSYVAKYAVLSDGKKLGKATRTLVNRKNQWILDTNAKISKFFLTMKSQESTEFQILNDQLQTDRFHTRTKITFKKAREMQQVFDWNKKSESGFKGKKKWQINLTDQAFDRVSHIVQLRADLLAGKQTFNYNVSYKGKMNDYAYHLEKHEIISTKIGKLKTLKLVRNKSAKDTFILWLCPELNYFPVKIAQYEKDKPDITLLVESLDYQAKQ